MKHKILLSILTIFISFPAFSGPARKASVYFTQPDGTTFTARIIGDEYMKVVVTADGGAITKDKDGWWCYAQYDESGRKVSSGYRVGTEIPSSVMSSSRAIPYDKLSAKAKMKREDVRSEEEPLMARVLKHKRLETKAGGGEKITKHGLIILAEFKDRKFTYTRDKFIDMLTKEGYSLNGATGSAKEYFDDQFNGLFDFSFDVSPIVTLTRNVAFYGENLPEGDDKAPEKMIYDACQAVDKDIDFSKYDDDGDGFVDNVFVFFAGNDEAEVSEEDPDCIWSHAWYLFSGANERLILDGTQIDRYACTAELSRRYTDTGRYKDYLAGIGTFCHEYFHTFGIPDMYDTDYGKSGGMAAGLWAWTSLMDAGNQNNNGNTPPYLNAVEGEYLGISKPVTISGNGGYSLEPINQNGKFYRIDTDNKDEYYLLEYRGRSGWDAHVGGSGMLVYHIDKSNRNAGYSDTYESNLTAAERWEEANEVNSFPTHQCADLLEADARQDSYSENASESYYYALDNISGIFYPNSRNNSILPDSKPGLKHWSGTKSEISITNIRKTDNGVSFNVLGFANAVTPPNVSSHSLEAFMDAAIIQFGSDRSFDGEAVVEWGKTGGVMETTRVKPYEAGRYSITLEGLQPDNKTYSVNIHFELDGLTGEVYKISFMTKKTPAVSWPYIYMGGVLKNSDGTLPVGAELPLRLYNASDAAEIRWTFRNGDITVEQDGYYTVTKDGTLKAYVTWEDGTEEIIMKEIKTGPEGQK